MRLGIYQCPSPAGDVGAGLKAIATALTQANAAGVDMLVLPELFLPGYNSEMGDRPEGWDATLATLRASIAAHGVALTIGLPEWDGSRCYNAAFAFDGTGAELVRYRKVQLFGAREKALFQPGEAYSLFRYRDRLFALLICYDVEFPEHTRALARAGVEAILVPTANMLPYVGVNLTLLPARALESGLTIAYANYCGSEGDLTYTGRSLITGIDGPPLACMADGVGLIVADLDDVAATFPTPPMTQLQDLRVIPPPEVPCP